MAKRLMARIGEYTNREGEVKGEWQEVGVILSNQNGEYALIDPKVNLAGVLTTQNMYAAEKKRNGDDKARTGKMLMCSIFEDKEPDQQPAPQPSQGVSKLDDFSDDIPF